MQNPAVLIIAGLAVAAYNLFALTKGGEAPATSVFWLHVLFAIGGVAGVFGGIMKANGAGRTDTEAGAPEAKQE